ncbi:MAG: hypothetical protein Kow006_18560 [Gammaproteobacteria bacterium]
MPDPFLPSPLRSGWLKPQALSQERQQALWRFAALLDRASESRIGLTMRPLASLPGACLVQGLFPEPDQGFGFALWNAHEWVELDGTAVPIYEVCDDEPLRFDSENLLEYVTLFSRFVYAGEGPFWIVIEAEDLNAGRPPAGPAGKAPDSVPCRYDDLGADRLRRLIAPPKIEPVDAGWQVETCLQYGSDLARARFRVTGDGAVEMVEDSPLVTGIPLLAERNRPLRRLDFAALSSRRATTVVTDAQGRPLSDSELNDTLAALGITTHHGKPGGRPNERSLQRSLLAECLRLQLVWALRRGDAEPLFPPDPGLSDDDLLSRFAAFLVRSWPAVVVESPYPRAEQIVASLLVDTLTEPPRQTHTQRPVPGEPDMIAIPPVADHDLLTLSFHGARKLLRPEAAAWHLGATENLTFVGCNTLSDLPPPLQRMADVVLRLGALDTRLFRQLFCAVFECEWPEGLSLERETWPHYVDPYDLERPLRDRSEAPTSWQPEQALAAIRERVERRLASIGCEDAPDLDQLHGMEAAKAVITDLIDDLRGAIAGELEWGQVDRGLLLVGDPGTGKTMLARAAAKAAGVHFISTSASRWSVNAGDFTEVLRTIRDVFAEARRHAPCILFIDELDSLGRRDQMVDQNRQLELEELNTVLQELQGFRDREGVFVIGATNHLDRIDPALTRAGRLDQVVHIPRPNRAALAAILCYQLQELTAEDRVDPDLDPDSLAALAVGCTGADIEAFVRDAARRARKAGRRITAEHLAAAITRAPREQAHRPLAGPEQERVAYHEAGHALACLLAEHYPAELTMVSIVPRSDGSLGFAGFYTDSRRALTRAAHREYLEILLAGRAAEELRYGAEGVSSGAGGGSPNSDLALATRHLSRMLTELGLHDAGSLRWRSIDERPDDPRLIGELLEAAYERVRTRLSAHRPLLKAIAGRLQAESELLAEELRTLADRHSVKTAATGAVVPSR